jgi:hypothetical protein
MTDRDFDYYERINVQDVDYATCGVCYALVKNNVEHMLRHEGWHISTGTAPAGMVSWVVNDA